MGSSAKQVDWLTDSTHRQFVGREKLMGLLFKKYKDKDSSQLLWRDILSNLPKYLHIELFDLFTHFDTVSIVYSNYYYSKYLTSLQQIW